MKVKLFACAVALLSLVLLGLVGCASLNPVGTTSNPFGGLLNDVQDNDLTVETANLAIVGTDIADPSAVAAVDLAGQKAFVVVSLFEKQEPQYESADALLVPTGTTPNPTQAQVDAANASLVADLAELNTLDGSTPVATAVKATVLRHRSAGEIKAHVAALKKSLHRF